MKTVEELARENAELHKKLHLLKCDLEETKKRELVHLQTIIRLQTEKIDYLQERKR